MAYFLMWVVAEPRAASILTSLALEMETRDLQIFSDLNLVIAWLQCTMEDIILDLQ